MQATKPKTTCADRTTIALSIAGSDSGGGAGIQADLKTFSALGVYGASAITAVTAQNTLSVTAVHNIPAQTVSSQISAVLDDLDVSVIKIGMLSSVEIIDAVARAITDFNGPVVLDPVMVSKSGDRLLQSEAIDALREQLLPRANLITPNLPEAATLLDVGTASSPDEAIYQGEAIKALGARAVLMKGGHAEGATCTDFLVSDQPLLKLSATRVNTRCTHGTGCTLSAAIAACLGKGDSLVDAVTNAHQYLQKAISQAERLGIGQGHGPVHHFHSLWGNLS